MTKLKKYFIIYIIGAIITSGIIIKDVDKHNPCNDIHDIAYTCEARNTAAIVFWTTLWPMQVSKVIWKLILD